MRSFLRMIAVTALFCFAFVFAGTTAVSAWNPFSSIDCSGEAATSAVCADRGATDDPITGSDGLIMRIVTIVAFVAGAAAVIIIILAGLRMVTSGGSSDDVAAARRTLIYAIVGLIIISISRIIIGLVINSL